MSVRSPGWRKVTRRDQTVLLLDFYFFDSLGRRKRFRKDATVQTVTACTAEARRLMAFANEHGYVDERDKPVTPGQTAKKEVPTFREFAEGDFTVRFLPTFKPETARRYRDLLRQDILTQIGKYRLDEIDGTKFRDFALYLQTRPRKKGKGTGVQTKGPLTLVRTILRAAVEMEHLPELPRLPALVKQSKKLPRGPVRSEVEQLLAVAPTWLGVAIGLAAFGGLRSGEVRALEVRDLDLDRGLIMVRRNISDGVVTTTKGDEERDVPIPLPLMKVLRDASRGRPKSHRLVLTPKGETPSRQRLLREIRVVQQKHGLPSWGVHSLRHFFCSELSRQKIGVESIRRLAGHQDIETTARYLHVTEDDLREAAKALGGK